MANIKSQIKRNRQNEKRRLRNRVVRGQTRSAIKTAQSAIEAGQVDASRTAVMQAISRLDKAAQQGVLHKNNVARRKSRLLKQLAGIKPAEVVEVRKIEEPPAAETKTAVEPAKKATTRKAAAPKSGATKTAASKKTAAPKKKETAAPSPKPKKVTTAKKTTAKPKKTSAK